MATASGVGVGPASALNIGPNSVGIDTGDIGSYFTVTYDYDVPGPINVAGAVKVTVDSFSSTQIQLTFDIENLTDPALQASITAFGFDTDPDLTFIPGRRRNSPPIDDGIDVVDDGELDWAFTREDNISGGFSSIDVCAFPANNCSGGNQNDGLRNNNSSPGGDNKDEFVLILRGNFGATPQITLSNFPIKFQTSIGSFHPNTTSEGGGTLSTVPVPAAVWLFGAGLGALGVLSRRRRAASADHAGSL